MKAHSGWAALVVLRGRPDHDRRPGDRKRGNPDGDPGGDLFVVDRRRMDLAEDDWAKAPYHAAEDLEPAAARELVRRGVEAARRIAIREMRAALQREEERGHDVGACAVLVGNPMPDWTTDEILAVHFRMHKAEGVLFQDVLLRAAEACGIRPVPIPEKRLAEQAGRALGQPADGPMARIAGLGRSLGPPWGRDQKDAALAALIALQGHPASGDLVGPGTGSRRSRRAGRGREEAG